MRLLMLENLAIEAVDRAMRGEGAPSPIYEGEDSVISRVLRWSQRCYIMCHFLKIREPVKKLF